MINESNIQCICRALNQPRYALKPYYKVGEPFNRLEWRWLSDEWVGDIYNGLSIMLFLSLILSSRNLNIKNNFLPS